MEGDFTSDPKGCSLQAGMGLEKQDWEREEGKAEVQERGRGHGNTRNSRLLCSPSQEEKGNGDKTPVFPTEPSAPGRATAG